MIPRHWEWHCSSRWTGDTKRAEPSWMNHTGRNDPGLPLSWHRHGLSCTPSGRLSCLTLPRALWPSSSWVWTWACGRRSWTRWAWPPGGHTAPGRPWACPYRWMPGRSCRTGHGTGSPHLLLQLHWPLHPPWSGLTQGCEGPSPPRQGSLGPAPALEHALSGWGEESNSRRQASSFCQR